MVTEDQPVVGMCTNLQTSTLHLSAYQAPQSPEPNRVAGNTEIQANIMVLDLQKHTLEQVGQLKLKAKERDALQNPRVIPFGDKLVYYVEQYNWNAQGKKAFSSVIPASSIFK